MRIKSTLTLIIIFLSPSIYGGSYTRRDILDRASRAIDFPAKMITDLSWVDFPSYYERDFWNSLPGELSTEYIAGAEKYLTYDWPIIKATDYLEFIRSGNRRQEAFGAPKAALLSLIMGELAEGKGRFIDQIVNGVWFYCEQTWWGWSAHMYLQKEQPGLPDINDRTIDLNVGDMANILSWTWYYFHEEFEKIHPLIPERLKSEIRIKAIDPYLERTDFWWMGIEDQSHINNWNPWINFNMLTCFLLMEDNPERKISGVKKIIQSLDVFINSYPDDGGCIEGPSYWGAAVAQLYKNLHLLGRISRGKLDIFNHPLIQNMGQYIYKLYIHLPYFVNFADADAQITSTPLQIYMYGKSINDPVLWKFGAFLAQNSGWGNKPFGGTPDAQITSLMYRDELLNARADEALIGSFWLPDTEVAGARDSEGTYKGFYFAAKGGNNIPQNHNHNDAGSCVLYFNRNPVLIDVGRETYTAKTFGSERYTIWTMQSRYHNLPIINGIDQMQGKEYKAAGNTFHDLPSKAVFSTDISKAYPKEAMVKSWKRTYTLQKGKHFEIMDEFKLNGISDKASSLNFMTSSVVTMDKKGVLKLEGMGGTLRMTYNPNHLEPSIEIITLTDNCLKQFWPGELTRIVLTLKKPELEGMIKVRISE